MFVCVFLPLLVVALFRCFWMFRRFVLLEGAKCPFVLHRSIHGSRFFPETRTASCRQQLITQANRDGPSFFVQKHFFLSPLSARKKHRKVSHSAPKKHFRPRRRPFNAKKLRKKCKHECHRTATTRTNAMVPLVVNFVRRVVGFLVSATSAPNAPEYVFGPIRFGSKHVRIRLITLT